MTKKVAVVGAGISGLSTAFYLKNAGHNVSLFEASSSAGGCIRTFRENNFCVEAGPNSFLAAPETLNLIKKLGLEGELIEAEAHSRRRFIYTERLLREIPTNPTSLLSSNLLSPWAKIRILGEALFPPARAAKEESVFDWAKRHFGAEIAEIVVSPMVVGVFGGDAKKLSLEKAFPKLRELENENPSLIRGALKKKDRPRLLSFKDGMDRLISGLSEYLKENLLLSHPVETVRRENNEWQLTALDKKHAFDDVVFCCGASALLDLFGEELSLSAKRILAGMTHSALATCSFGFSERISFNGFGALMTRNENIRILGFLHPTDIFKGRSPNTKSLVTVMLGGVLDPEVETYTDLQIENLARGDLQKVLGSLPSIEHVWTWKHKPGIPQYHLSEAEDLASALREITSQRGLHIQSNLVGGVAINDCILKASQLSIA